CVSLAEAQALRSRSVQRRNRRNTGNAANESGEHARKSDFRAEAELKDDVFHAVASVVDLHLIQNVWIERKVVGAIRRFEKRIDVQNQDDLGRILGTNEREPICYVSLLVKRGDGRFTMAGGKERCDRNRDAENSGSGPYASESVLHRADVLS